MTDDGVETREKPFSIGPQTITVFAALATREEGTMWIMIRRHQCSEGMNYMERMLQEPRDVTVITKSPVKDENLHVKPWQPAAALQNVC